MEYAILLIVGFFVGIIVFRLPSSGWLKKEIQLDKEAFKTAYPSKFWIYYFYAVSPIVWMVIYAFVVFPGLSKMFDESSLISYFAGYLLVGGFGILDGILELTAGISPIRQGGGPRGSSRLSSIIVDDSVRQVGLLRLSLIGGIGILSWLIIYLMI